MAIPNRSGEPEIALPVLQSLATTHAWRKLAFVLGLLFAALPLLSSFVPWQQNVPGTGRVTAFDPLDRIRTIPAPVSGRLVRVHVQEGSRVEEGALLAEMEDQDPSYSLRLEQQLEFANQKVEAAKGTLEFYELQLSQLEESRTFALQSARFQLAVAIEKVVAEERDLEGLEAELEQKRADRERKWNLLKDELVSELDYQKAESDFLAARAKVEGAKAKVEQARNDEKSKMANIDRVGASEQAKIESTKSAREDARSKLALAEKERTEAMTAVVRQETQVITAPRSGTVLRIHGASSSDLISKGEPLIELVPDTEKLAVEFYVRGIDAPLISQGRTVRLQFEGWPAVQFAGWPSVAVGTFGGIVQLVDAQAQPDGRFRVLVLPDPKDEEWPDQRYLRQGVRASGWVQLDTVSLGYEVWRQLNAFPPSVRTDKESAPKKKDKPKTDDAKEGKKS